MIRIALPRTLYIAISSVVLLLAGCGGGGGDSSIKVVIRGAVDSLVGTGGTASMITPAGTTTAPVSTDGKFEITLQTPDPQAFVALRARGTGDRSRAEFESLLGSAESLKDSAGSDGVLTTADENKVDLNSLQTAIAAILRKVNGHSGKAATTSLPDLSDEELAALESQVDPAQALTLGAALELGVKNRAVDFPDAFGTTLELALDQQASDDYVETQVTQNAVAFQEEVTALSELAGQSIGFTPQNVPALAHFATTSSVLTQDGEEYRFNQDGTGTLALSWSFTNSPDNETTFTWTIQSGTLALTLNPPLTDTVTSVLDLQGNEVQTSCTLTLTAITLQPIAVTASGTSVVANYTASQSCPSRPDLSRSISFTRLGQFVPSANFVPYTSAELTVHPLTLDIPTQRTIGASGSVPDLDSDILTFAGNGTGTTEIHDETFDWTLAAGELHVTFSSGASAIYRKLFAIGDGGQFRVADRITTASGTIFLTTSSSSPVTSSGFTSPPGDYHQNGIGTEACVGVINEFVIHVGSDGNASQLTFSNAGPLDICEPLLGNDGLPVTPTLNTRLLRPWRLDPVTGELILERTFDNATQSFDNCDPAADSQCTVADQRRVRRLSVSGQREFWLESRRIPCSVPEDSAFCGVDPIESAPADHLVRFYDKEPAGSFTPAKSARVAEVRIPYAIPGPSREYRH